MKIPGIKISEYHDYYDLDTSSSDNVVIHGDEIYSYAHIKDNFDSSDDM